MLRAFDPNRRLYESAEATELYSGQRNLTPCEAALFKKYVQPGMRILDLGVGAGRTTEFLGAAASLYVGVDYSEELLRAARERFRDFMFVLGDAAEISIFPDACFDLIVFSFNGLDNLQSDSNRRACLRKSAGLLKPGGRFILSRHNARYLFRRLTDLAEFRDPGRLSAIFQGKGYVELRNHRGLRNHFISREHASAEFEQAGFEVLEVVSSEYPRRQSTRTTPWYYYVLQKNVGVAKPSSW